MWAVSRGESGVVGVTTLRRALDQLNDAARQGGKGGKVGSCYRADPAAASKQELS